MGDRPTGAPCPACGRERSAAGRFCEHCGAPAQDITRTSLGPTSASAPFVGPASSGAAGGERFLPGATIAGRYRILGLLGRGGMGEVYRADDLKLGQPVALKFLPEALQSDPERLQRFLGEVRVARQVSHPGVCRVYDVGEVDGQHYLSMEYVDGEDLGSLLRRIGRLPRDKATQIARQLCAGLAAAHDQGIVHRDLKPANVMIDGRGRAKITDFGLAALAEDVRGVEVRAGTPAYMAPEQLQGAEVTVRSDVYALGLVLYEMYTGKVPHAGKSAAELARLRSESLPASPTTEIDSLDPAVESTILRCLEPDPADRPPSALAVAAGLPGGDPLAAALAAGETPSPELVAESGRIDAMPTARAALLAGAGLALILFVGFANGRDWLLGMLPLDRPPAVLEDRARQAIEALGYEEPAYADPVDRAWGFNFWTAELERIRQDGDVRQALRNPDAGVLAFWYRQAPYPLRPSDVAWGSFAAGPVSRWDPFPSGAGGVLVSLNPEGRLRFFVATPRRMNDPAGTVPPPDWSVPFELAGLDMATFRDAPSRYQRFLAPDRRIAWLGELPDRPGEEIRIEAGSIGGRIVLFGILEASEMERLGAPPGSSFGMNPQFAIAVLVITGALIGACFLARANLRAGRADRRGAWRAGWAVFVLAFVSEGLRAHGVFTLWGFPAVYPILATALFYATFFAVLYLAIEPHLRRIWPTMLVSWSRIVTGSGRWLRDPLVGRSILWGVLVGAALVAFDVVERLLDAGLVGAPLQPYLGNTDMLHGPARIGSVLTGYALQATVQTLVIPLFLVVGRLVFRRTWAAVGLTVLLVALLAGTRQGGPAEIAIGLAAVVAGLGLVVALTLEHGIFAAIVAAFVSGVAGSTVAFADSSAWYARPTWVGLVCLVALSWWGFHAARGPATAPAARS